MQHGVDCGCCFHDYWTKEKLEAFVATMADQETPESRPKCDWEKDRGKPQSVPCGSETDLFKVKRVGPYGMPREHDICQRHLADSWKKWSVQEAVKRPTPSRTTGQ